MQRLHELLMAPRTRDEALELLRGLVERVLVRPIDDGWEIEFIGEIANMVALAASPKAENTNAARLGRLFSTNTEVR